MSLSSSSEGPPASASPRDGMLALLAVALLDGVGVSIVLPLLPFLALHFHGPAAVVTLLVAGYNLAAFFANLVMGRLSDRMGRVKILRLSLIGTFVSYVGILLAWSLSGLFAFRLLGGLVSGRAAVLPALATDGRAPTTHVQRLAWLAAAGAIGMVIGPIIAGVIAWIVRDTAVQYRLTLGFALGLTLLAALWVGRMEAPAPSLGQGASATRAAREPVNLRPLWLPFAISTATAYGQGVVLSVTALLVQARFGWGVRETGLLLGLLAVGLAVARVFVLNRLVEWLGLEASLCACLAIVVPTLALAGVATSPAAFVCCIAVFSFAGGLANMLPGAMISMRAPAPARGYVLGVNSGLCALALFVSATANGLLFQFVGPWAPFALGAGVLALGLALGLTQLRQARRAALQPAS